MRLLSVQDLENPRLVEFPEGTACPPYAILSHTWGGEEVSFQDMQRIDHRVKCKAGYRKIHGSCKLARSNGHRYIWIDTCCIDKSSSAELSEAINAMFRWYRGARVCYVYLADVPTPSELSWSFERSRWFRRGWTLQELLAPLNVVFYAENWMILGTKLGLRKVLSDVTGIDLRVLEGAPLRDICAAQKMSWASSRSTSRTEDTAYSLLGIFDVNMPLLYGEGSKAFVRLQQEIMKSTDDVTLFVWDDDDGSCPNSGLLARSPRNFEKGARIFPTEVMHPLQYEITNRGVRMEAILYQSCGLWFLALDCAYIRSRLKDTSTRLCLIPLHRISPDDSSDNRYVRRGLLWHTVLSIPSEARTTIYVPTYDAFDTTYVQAELEPLRYYKGFHARGMSPEINVGFQVHIDLSCRGYYIHSKHPAEAWDDINGRGTDLWFSTTSTTRSIASKASSEGFIALSSASTVEVYPVEGVLGALVFRKTTTSVVLALLVGFSRVRESEGKNGNLHGAVQLKRLDQQISDRSWPEDFEMQAQGLSCSRIKIPEERKTITAQFDVIRREPEGTHKYELSVYTRE